MLLFYLFSYIELRFLRKCLYRTQVDNNIHACVYKIKGTTVASPYQFWISDSSHHFLRGALYFNTTPNNDSLAPAIDFLAKDITHLVSTFRWRK